MPIHTSGGLADAVRRARSTPPSRTNPRGGLRAAGPHERPDARQRDDEPGRRERSRPQISAEAQQLGERDDDALERQERHHEGPPRGQATKPELRSVDGEQPPEQQVGAEREDESEPSQGQRLAHQGASAASGAGVATPVRMSTTSASPGEPSDRTAATTSAIENGSTSTSSAPAERAASPARRRGRWPGRARVGLDAQAVEVVEAVAGEVDDGGVGPVERRAGLVVGLPQRAGATEVLDLGAEQLGQAEVRGEHEHSQIHQHSSSWSAPAAGHHHSTDLRAAYASAAMDVDELRDEARAVAGRPPGRGAPRLRRDPAP